MTTKAAQPEEGVQSIVRRIFASSPLYSSIDAPRWRVERIGSATGGYGLGWHATSLRDGTGAFFLTHREALDFAFAQVAIDAVGAA